MSSLLVSLGNKKGRIVSAFDDKNSTLENAEKSQIFLKAT